VNVDEFTFKKRTKEFGLAAIRLVENLPRNRTSDVIGRQLLRPATSVGANYRAACRGRSSSDVLSKLAIVEEEAGESLYLIELLIDSGTISANHASSLINEGNQIVAMTVASIKTLRKRMGGAEIQNPTLKGPAQGHNANSPDASNPK
jgi:four helix bundle protein